MAFVSLGQVHRRVRAAGRRSGDLYERVPALLVLSGQQARVGPAAAGEGEVGRGHDRAVLRRPDQANAGNPGPLLVLHRTGRGASTPARRSRDQCVLRRQYRAQDTRKRGRRAHRGQGELPTRSLREAGEGGRGLLRSRVRATALVQPRSTIDGGRGLAKPPAPSALRKEDTYQDPESLARHSISGSFRTLSGRPVSGRPDTSTRSTPEAYPSRTRTALLSRIVPWLFPR